MVLPRATEALGLDAEGRVGPPIEGEREDSIDRRAVVRNLSANDLLGIAQTRKPPISLRGFPSLSRSVWESQAPAVGQIARLGQVSIALWYVWSSPESAPDRSSSSLVKWHREARDACGELMDLTFLGWALRTIRAWRPWQLRRRVVADE